MYFSRNAHQQTANYTSAVKQDESVTLVNSITPMNFETSRCSGVFQQECTSTNCNGKSQPIGVSADVCAACVEQLGNEVSGSL